MNREINQSIGVGGSSKSSDKEKSTKSHNLQLLFNKIISNMTRKKNYVPESKPNLNSKFVKTTKYKKSKVDNTILKKYNKNTNSTNLNSTNINPTNFHSNNYIKKLIDLYYDNDKVTYDFLHNGYKKQSMFPPQNRIIVIGDIHGDFTAAIKCFILSGCIEHIDIPDTKSVSKMDTFFNKLKWIGGDTHVVQLGDQIDRVRPQNWDDNNITNDNAFKDEGSTLEIFYLFYYLDKLARKTSGRVFSIIGNHEIMNINGDFRYVSLKEFKCFKDHLNNTYNSRSKFPYQSKTLKKYSYKLKDDNYDSGNNRLPNGYRERLLAFSPTGLCSNMIAENNYTVLQIGNWMFCHGSPVFSTFNTYSIDLINNIVSMYLLGIETKDKAISHHYNVIAESEHDNSVLWNRDFGETQITKDIEHKLSKQLDSILEAYNKTNNNDKNDSTTAKNVCVGHTIQDTGDKGINSICNGRVWRCDVAMSRAFGEIKNEPYRQPQVLEIIDGVKTKILM
jgi:hypothetical protein